MAEQEGVEKVQPGRVEGLFSGLLSRGGALSAHTQGQQDGEHTGVRRSGDREIQGNQGHEFPMPTLDINRPFSV